MTYNGGMLVTKCDICKKQIKEREPSFYLRKTGLFESFEFCINCGRPLEKFLKNRKLIKSADEKHK